ncbi:MAG: Ig-like domain-containing protein [Lentimicrobiaceae bacterium]|jgi:hypothetical protein|nr:Ig-like domain-containing protein [Lentimicrobiaceae bacterium]
MKKALKNVFVLLMAFVALLMLQFCAHPVMPAGGEKDITPPKILQSIPENQSINFDGKTITLTFDEFVKLDNPEKKVLISPPVIKNPEYKLRGKSLTITLKEDLYPETTYLISFADAIKDLTEGNPLGDFVYVFSTGKELDSLSLAGNIKQAFDLKPAEEVWVMLYKTDVDTIPLDSLPYLERPYYLTKTTKTGNFRFQNLKNESFMLFALHDMNSNMLFDMPTERIAFLDSLVRPVFVAERKPVDSLKLLPDSLSYAFAHTNIDSLFFEPMTDSAFIQTNDSIIEDLQAKPKEMNLELHLFLEEDSVQRLLRTETVRDGLLRFDFRYPAKNVILEPIDQLPDSFEIMPVYTPKYDTLFWYYTKNVLDSLNVHIHYDTLINDTLEISLKARQVATRPTRRKEKEEITPRLKINTNLKNSKLAPDTPLLLSFDEPIVNVIMRDTTWYIAKKDTIIDTLYNRLQFEKADDYGFKYRFVDDYDPEKSISIIFPDSTFFGFSGLTNDTTHISYRIATIEEYGNLYINIWSLSNSYPILIQLLTDKETLIEQRVLRQDEELVFENLVPAKYKLKAIYDNNNNSRWDSGNFLRKIQPEKVVYFEKTLEIRANWDFEEEWELP